MSQNLYSTGLLPGATAANMVKKTTGAVANTVSDAVNSVQETAREAASTLFSSPANMFQSGIRLLFFLSLGALFLFLFLTLIHFTVTPVFSFMPGDSGIISIAPAGPKQSAYISTPAAFNQAANFSDFYAFNVSFAFDLYVATEFSTTVPRVVWYKSATPILLGATDSTDDLKTKFASSNLVLYMDAQKNDLKAMILYTDNETKATVAKHETCVENVPLRKPIRIGIIMFQKFVEIYMNGKLVRTIPGDSNLLVDEATVRTTVFGPPARVADSVKLARLTYWPYIVSPQIMRIDAAEPMDAKIFA